MGNKLFKVVLIVASLVLLSAGLAFAADNNNYTFEVKFLLDSSKVLDANNVPVKDLQDLFAVKKTNQRTVLYVETPDRTFNNGGWINRVREKEGKKNVELAYKKRYTVQGTDIAGAFDRAIKDNPRITDGRYEAEIDWGYEKMTLSFTNEVKIDKPAGGMKGMSNEDILSNVLANMPEDEGGWMFAKLKSARIPNARFAGPVDYIRYVGSYKDVEIDIEVWPVKDTVITELSFEAEGLANAEALRNEVMAILESRGILLKRDSLKTQMILDAFI